MLSNNVTRLLDNRKIKYQIFEMEKIKRGASETAQKLGVAPALIYKSIVIIRKKAGKPILAVIPGDREVDLKALAKAVKEKKVSPATQAEAERMTGLKAGGISPLALVNRGFEIILDQSMLEKEKIHISGGERGVSVRLAPQDLIDLTHGKLAAVSSLE